MFLVGICSSPILGQGLPLIVVDNTMDSSWLRHYQIDVLKRFELISEKDVLRKREALSKARPLYRNRPNFARATGYAYRLTPTGQTITSGFVTVSHDEVFDQFVTDQVSRLESIPELRGAVVVERIGKRTVVSSPDYEQKIQGPPGQPAVIVRHKNQDLHLSYAGGVIVFGQQPSPARSAELPLRELQSRLKRAKGLTRYLSYMPGESMVRDREAAMSLVMQAAAPKRQQRDNESDAEYRRRRFFSDELLKIVRMAVLDVRELEAWTKWPGDKDSPFVAELKLTPKTNSKLDTLLRQIRVPRRSHMAQPGSFGTARLQIELPESLRSFLRAWVDRQELGPVAQPIISEALKSEEIVTCASMLAVEGEIRTTVQLNLPAPRRQAVADWVDRRGVSRHVKILNTEFDDWMWATKGLDSGVLVAFGADVPVSAELQQETEDPASARNRVRPALEVNVDLSRYIGQEPDESGRRLIELIEELYVRGWVFRKHPAPIAQSRRFKSLAGLGNAEDDWTARISVTVRGGTLRARCRLGNALFTWLQLRSGFGFQAI
jgi:hypothetical protein